MAGNDFRLAFDDVERVTVGFSQARYHVDDEHRQQRQPVPRQEVHALVGEVADLLAANDVDEVQAARDHQHDDHHEAHRDFI
ncbi:hypothetical protein D3C72_2056500 [compost metagenome]